MMIVPAVLSGSSKLARILGHELQASMDFQSGTYYCAGVVEEALEKHKIATQS